MARWFGILVAVGALATAGVATSAYAQTQSQSRTHADDQNRVYWSSNGAARSLQWDGKGRWGLKFDYQQPTTRDLQWNDVDAGIYFKANPRLRLGAAVNLATGQSSEQPRMAGPDERPQPRVRLETLFRF